MTRPPRLARALLGRLLPRDIGDDASANLEDLYACRLQRHGRLRAGVWFWRQTVVFPLRMRLARAEGARPAPLTRVMRAAGQLARDLKLATRALIHQPAFSVTAAGTLAVGLAANISVFAVVNAAMLRGLPFPEPDRLVWLWPDGDFAVTLQQFDELESAARPDGELSAWASRAFVVTGGDRPVEVTGAAVSANHFEVFGLQPSLGRGFSTDDALPGAAPVVIVSDAVWRAWFGADPSLVGRTVQLDVAASIPMQAGAFTGEPRTVIGVLPPHYRPFGLELDVVTPLVLDRSDPNFENLGELTVVGRLGRGVTASMLGQRVDARLGELSSFSRTADDERPRSAAMPIEDVISRGAGAILWLTLGAVGLVLLLASANVAHLTLARLGGRRHEFAVRLALGASRGRLARQLLAESFAICCAGALGGLLLAATALPTAARLLPGELGVFVDEVAIDGHVLLFLAVVLAGTTVVVGLAPILGDTRRLARSLGARGAGGHDGPGRSALHQGLVAAEIALALIVVSSAALLIASVSRLTNVDPGFESEGVVTARVAPSDARYRDAGVRRDTYARILARLEQEPGVEQTGAIHFLPIADGGPSIRYLMAPDGTEMQTGAYRVVTPGYFETMRIRLTSGRVFSGQDVTGAAGVGIVNEQLAADLWPGERAVGQRLYRTNGREFFEVIGVVVNVRQQGLSQPPAPEIYLPLAQTEWASAMTIVARVSGNTGRLLPRLDAIVRDVDAGLAVTRLDTMDALIAGSIRAPRFYSTVFSSFGVLALLLGGVGVYGVSAFLSGRRRREIGIRIALGASRASILRLECRRGGLAAAAGLAAGLAGAIGTGRLLTGLLYEISPAEPMALIGATVVLAVVALAGVYLPAHSAASVDPMVAVRE